MKSLNLFQAFLLDLFIVLLRLITIFAERIIMGTTKTMLFAEEVNTIAEMAKALAHPARITIISRLLQTETCVCGDFVEDLGLAQSTVSQHLLALKKVGIIQGTVQGPSTCYCLNPEKWNELKNSLGKFIHQEVVLKSMCC